MGKEIKNYWDKRSNSYSDMIKDELNSFKREAWMNLIREKLEGKDKIKALDVGAGPGFLSIIMDKMGYEVTALDLSDQMIKEAKENAKVAGCDIRFINNDIALLDSNEKFDLIVSRNVTWTLEEPEEVYKGWFDLLNDDGVLIIFDANWYLRLSKDSLKDEYEHDMEEALKMGYDDGTTESQCEECEAIAKRLPMTYNERPTWDKKVLKEIGFNKIVIDSNISDKIYTEVELKAYETTPMFSIAAYK